jgi:PKD repeat protein
LTVADFTAENYTIPVNGTVNFQDLSSGKPDKWHWYFQAGKPSESFEQNPTGIRFESYGPKNVKLVVSNPYNTDSIVKEGFIDVQAVVSPNPSSGVINILSDINNKSDITIEVYDAIGMKAQEFNYPAGSSSTGYEISLPSSGNVFIVRVIQGDIVQSHKVLVIK